MRWDVGAVGRAVEEGEALDGGHFVSVVEVTVNLADEYAAVLVPAREAMVLWSMPARANHEKKCRGMRGGSASVRTASDRPRSAFQRFGQPQGICTDALSPFCVAGYEASGDVEAGMIIDAEQEGLLLASGPPMVEDAPSSVLGPFSL